MEDCLVGFIKDGKILGEGNEQTEQNESKGSPVLEAVRQLAEESATRGESKSDFPWLMIMLILLFGGSNNGSGTEYWRGKYDALKEIYDARVGYSDIKLDCK